MAWSGKEQEAKVRVSDSHLCLKRSYKNDTDNFFDNTARDSSHMLHLRRFRLDIRQKLFPRMVVKSWDRSPKRWGNCPLIPELS